jgi:N-acetyl-anhydromuramyl-L-alanine amidase AmpD
MTPEQVRFLVVHCSATKASMDIGAKEIDRWHREKGWLGIGYHYVIRRDGIVEKGRPDNRSGAHAAGYNSQSIGICLVGGLDEKGNPKQNFTKDQYASLRSLLWDLLDKFDRAEVLGHRDLPGVYKDCPCFDVKSWWYATQQEIDNGTDREDPEVR